MFKKIALLSLLSAPLISAEAPKQDLIPSSITDSLKKLHEKADLIIKREKDATNMLYAKLARNQNESSALHIETSEILARRLPRLPRTKIFVAGSLVGFGTCLYLQKNNPKVFTYPQTLASRLQAAFTPSIKQTPIIIYDNVSAPDESGAQEEADAEEKAAQESNSCYFK